MLVLGYRDAPPVRPAHADAGLTPTLGCLFRAVAYWPLHVVRLTGQEPAVPPRVVAAVVNPAMLFTQE